MAWKKVTNEVLFEVLRKPVVTEKSTTLSQYNQIVFKVADYSTKTQIKQAVEQLFDVKVQAVNTLNTKAKQKRFRGKLGVRSGYKKAIVRLKDGQSIDVMAGVK